ncbi:uncharacterized protein [Euwallacea fornicatus]|uniref:uncharacterized protein isoform X2 n=1 Tax=Euwallacea fornicatus TaxID=995702 RepID=UPI0033902961
MSFKSNSNSTSRSRVELEALLHDEDLDYEPDWTEHSEGDVSVTNRQSQETPQPEPSGVPFMESSSSSNNISSCQPVSNTIITDTNDEGRSATWSIDTMRKTFYSKNVHTGVDSQQKGHYLPYMEDSEKVYLDSSSEEEENSYFSKAKPQKYVERVESKDQVIESPVKSQPLFSYPSDSDRVTSKVNIIGQISYDPISKLWSPHSIEKTMTSTSSTVLGKKSLNFTIKLMGNKRICLSSKQKTRKNPWILKQGWTNLNVLKLDDLVVKFCPSKQSSNSKGCKFSDNEESSNTGSLFKSPTMSSLTGTERSIVKSTTNILQDVPEHAKDNIDVISLTAGSIWDEDRQDMSKQDIYDTNKEAFNVSDGKDIRMSMVANWVMKTDSEYDKPTVCRNFDNGKVPFNFRGLCYHWFFFNSCRNIKLCRQRHMLDHVINKIRNSSNQDLLEAYNFTKLYPQSFKLTYLYFADIFASRDDKEKLIDIIEMVLEDECSSFKIEGVNVILKALQKTNLSIFEDAVDYIRNKVDSTRYPKLGEILIEIIIFTDNLQQNWPVLRKLCNIGEKIPLRLAQIFLEKLINEAPDQHVCREIYQHIIVHKCIDLPSISTLIRDPFLKMCTSLEKRKEPWNDKDSSVKNMGGSSFPSVNLSPPLSMSGSAIQNAKEPVQHLNFSPPSQFGMESDLQDFASLYCQQTQFDQGDRQLTFSRFETNTFRDTRGHTSHVSSEEGDRSVSNISLKDNYFRNPVFSTHKPQYNNKGLHYDPANDYLSTSKHLQVTWCSAEPSEVGGIMSEFERLKRSGSPDKWNLPINAPQSNHGDYRCGLSMDFMPLRYPKVSEHQRDLSKFNRLQRVRVDNIEGDERNAQMECAVTSSNDTVDEKEKPPEQPVFGQIHFDSNYELNVSLHNLYLQRIDNVDIDEEDVHRLNDCVKYGNGPMFLELLQKYISPTTVQNFIAMSLAHLKGTNQMVARTYKKLLQSVEETMPYFYGNTKVRVVFEVITMNLLFELEHRNLFEDARDILMKFSNWDSLITSRLFIMDTCTGMSVVGRYLFIAKLLLHTKPELTYEILVCRSLCFLEECHKWPYHPRTPIPEIFNSDLIARNLVLDRFLKEAYCKNPVVVIQLYKMALTKKGGIWNYDVKPFINPMLEHLIQSNQVGHLKVFFKDLHLFLDYIERLVLKTFLLAVHDHLSLQDKFKLLEACMAKDVYMNLFQDQVLSPVIDMKTNMTNNEIMLIILYYFNMLDKAHGLPSSLKHGLKFQIKMPGDANFPQKRFSLTNNIHRSLVEVNAYIKWVLMEKCGVSSSENFPNVVEVTKEELVKYLVNGSQ